LLEEITLSIYWQNLLLPAIIYGLRFPGNKINKQLKGYGMKRLLLTFVLALLSAFVFSQHRIAVFPFEDRNDVFNKGELDLIYFQFNNEFANKTDNSKFTVIPRQDVEKLIDKEVAFQLSDYSSKEKTAEIGKVINATQILSGNIFKVNNEIHVTVSLYTFPSLAVLPGGASILGADLSEILSKIPELVDKMKDAIIKGPLPPPSFRTFGYSFLNIFGGLGSLLDGDKLGAGIIFGGYAVTAGLIILEVNALDWGKPGAGVPGGIGLALGGLSLLYGLARPFIHLYEPRTAVVLDNVKANIVMVSDDFGNRSTVYQAAYTIKF
jgi:hypothetical protein